MLIHTLLTVLVFTLLSGCSTNSTIPGPANLISENTPQATGTPQNTRKFEPPISDKERNSLEASTQPFRQPSAEFENIDFRNFNYKYDWSGNGEKRVITLKDGSADYRSLGVGGDTFDFWDAFYTDLNDDGKKEAVVLLYHVACGGSCDGGAFVMFVFDPSKGRSAEPSMLELGSTGYGCAARSIKMVKDKIKMDVFGDCSVKHNFLQLTRQDVLMNKFDFKDITSLTFVYQKHLALESRKVQETDVRSALNYQPIIGVEN